MDYKYVLVVWPDSQYFVGQKHCHLVNDEDGFNMYGSSAYFVREDIYKKVINENEEIKQYGL